MAEIKYEFIKQNSSPITIDYLLNEQDERLDFTPSFWFNNKRYYLKDFVRTHFNPWITDYFPHYIHGMEYENYFNPIYIELLPEDEINVYIEKAVEL